MLYICNRKLNKETTKSKIRIMKTIETDNKALLEILAENGIEIICNDKMQMVITEGADKIEEIVEKYAPAAANDYSIVEY